MDDELQFLQNKIVWKLMPWPPEREANPVRRTSDLKVNGNNSASRFKTLVVEKGYLQIDGVDFSEAYTPVSKHKTVRLVVSFMAAHS